MPNDKFILSSPQILLILDLFTQSWKKETASFGFEAGGGIDITI